MFLTIKLPTLVKVITSDKPFRSYIRPDYPLFMFYITLYTMRVQRAFVLREMLNSIHALTHYKNGERKWCRFLVGHGSFACEVKYIIAIVHGRFTLTIVRVKRP